MGDTIDVILYENMLWSEAKDKINNKLPCCGDQDAWNLITKMVFEWNFFRTNRNNATSLRFVGTFRASVGKQPVHITVAPKYLAGKDDDVKAKMPYVLRAIEQTGHLYDYEPEAPFDERSVQSTPKKMDRHTLAAWIVRDYERNGIFFLREKRHTAQPKGRIDWGRTVARRTPVIDGDDVIYDRPIYTFTSHNDRLLLSEIHRVAVCEALDYLKKLGEAQYTVPPECSGTVPLGKLAPYANVVRRHQRAVFSNRDIALLRALEAWCATQSRYYDLPVGTVSFDKVWEDCLRAVFGNIDKSFTFGKPAYRLHTENAQYQPFSLNSDTIPDVINIFDNIFDKDGPRFLLLDAKYYLGSVDFKNKTIKDFPGAKDIAKQLDYSHSLRTKYGLSSGVNAFVMPWYNIDKLSPLSEECVPPKWRYLGYVTKNQSNDDPIWRKLKELGGPQASVVGKPDEQDEPEKIAVIQVDPDWLYRQTVQPDGKKEDYVRALWDFIDKQTKVTADQPEQAGEHL